MSHQSSHEACDSQESLAQDGTTRRPTFDVRRERESARRSAVAKPREAELPSQLVGRHEEFLHFIVARVSNWEEAQDLLQAAYIKAIEKARTVRRSEATAAWFYRLLRNSIIDHYRHRASERRAMSGFEAEAREAGVSQQPSRAPRPCCCLDRALRRLKPEYRELLERVDMRGQPISQASQQLGITANNTRVRLHRARSALRSELDACHADCHHPGTTDCGCTAPARPAQHG